MKCFIVNKLPQWQQRTILLWRLDCLYLSAHVKPSSHALNCFNQWQSQIFSQPPHTLSGELNSFAQGIIPINSNANPPKVRKIRVVKVSSGGSGARGVNGQERMQVTWGWVGKNLSCSECSETHFGFENFEIWWFFFKIADCKDTGECNQAWVRACISASICVVA